MTTCLNSASMVPGPKARMQAPPTSGARSRTSASMVPGPKARMQASRACSATWSSRTSFNGARPEGQDAGPPLAPTASTQPPCFNGARPEGQDAGERRRASRRRRVGASMVPGPKARMQGTRFRSWRASRSSLLQWCPARRPGCRWFRPFNFALEAMASMVPGPKARMQATAARCQPQAPVGFNGARPEGQDAGPVSPSAALSAGGFNGARPEGQDAGGCRPPRAAPTGCFNGARPEGQDAGA